MTKFPRAAFDCGWAVAPRSAGVRPLLTRHRARAAVEAARRPGRPSPQQNRNRLHALFSCTATGLTPPRTGDRASRTSRGSRRTRLDEGSPRFAGGSRRSDNSAPSSFRFTLPSGFNSPLPNLDAMALVPRTARPWTTTASAARCTCSARRPSRTRRRAGAHRANPERGRGRRSRRRQRGAALVHRRRHLDRGRAARRDLPQLHVRLPAGHRR